LSSGEDRYSDSSSSQDIHGCRTSSSSYTDNKTITGENRGDSAHLLESKTSFLSALSHVVCSEKSSSSDSSIEHCPSNLNYDKSCEGSVGKNLKMVTRSTPNDDNIENPSFDISPIEFADKSQHIKAEPQSNAENSFIHEHKVGLQTENISEVVAEQPLENVSNECSHALIQIMEKSLLFQENMLAAVSGVVEMNDGPLKHGIQNAMSIDENLLTEEEFIGMGESEMCLTSAQLEMLNIMRKRVISTRDCVEAYKTDRDSLRRAWKNKYMTSESRLEIHASVSSELADAILSVPLFRARSPIMTRSRARAASGVIVECGVNETKAKSKCLGC